MSGPTPGVNDYDKHGNLRKDFGEEERRPARRGYGGSFSTIDELPGILKLEKYTGTINGHFVEVGKSNNRGAVDYSVRVDGRAVATAVSESRAQDALRKAVT